MESYLDNGNYPPGFIDEGIKIKGGAIKTVDQDRMFYWNMRAWPRTINEAEAAMNVIRQNPKSHEITI